MRTTARPTTSIFASLIRLIAVLALVLGSGVAISAVASSSEPEPTIASDKEDYASGSTVNLNGAGWSGDTTVHLSINDTLGKTWQREVDVQVDGDGRISDTFVLPSTFVAQYDVLATGLQTGRTATTTFTDASADLDQCANGGVGDPPESCNLTFPANWVNGNLGGSKSHYVEGDSIAYRMKLDGLVNGSSNTLTIAWDVTKSSKHAIDYLTDFDATVTDANPCTNVPGCLVGSENTFPMPQDPAIPFAQTPGAFSIFGGTITNVSGYGLGPSGNLCPPGTPVYAGDETRCITITFTAATDNPVIAWGGHIATRQNWGTGNSAVAITGSPFHMRLIALNGGGGNQDKSLSSDAVIFPATINIIKHTVPPSSTSFSFTGTPSPATNFSLTDNSGVTDATQTFPLNQEAQFQEYTFTEDAAPGYALGSISCVVTEANGGSSTPSLGNRRVVIDIEEGETRTCTFTNDLQTGTLTVIKHVVNDDGGTASAGDWSLHVKSGANEVTGSPQNGSEAGTQYTLDAGTYDVSETGGPGGYTFDGFTGDCNASGSVTVVAGQNVTCTLTNNDNTPQLKLVKNVTNNDGGTATSADFDLSATGTSRSFSSKTASPVFHDVTAGVTYTLSETGPAGYTAGAWSCDGGTQVGSTIQVPLGGSVTCTIANTDDTPQLKLVKVVEANDGGTATAADFELSATGSSRSFLSQTASPVFHDVTAGVSYLLSESGPTGYTASAWSCTGPGVSQVGASVSVALGGSVTCTITNTDNTPRLKLVKIVTNNDGGTSTAADFTLAAAAAGDPLGRNFTSKTASPVFHNVSAGAVYDLSETGPAGYTGSTWSCDGGTQNGATIQVPLGADVTCTITNTDDTPRLKLIKIVTNSDGGAATSADFTLAAAAAGDPLGRNFTSKTASPVFHSVAAGAVYDLSETGPAGYTASAWSCDGGTQNGATIAVPLGVDVTCTITNSDDTPQLMLVKVVDANDGGAATAADFNLSAAAAGNPLGRNFSSQTASPTFHSVAAGAVYDLSETGPLGYTASSWVCTGTGGTQQGATIAVALGGSVTCTITNTDDTPQLKLVKIVTNNDGGGATSADFNLSATAVGNPLGRNFSTQTSTPTFHNVSAGAVYTLSETGPAGYTASTWSCDGGTQVFGTILVPLGAQVTCTITNTDDTPQLKLVKVVDANDGGTATAASFNLTAAAAGNPLGRNFSSQTATPGFHNVAAGAVYDLSETGPLGYTASAWVCTGPGATQQGATIAVALGGSVTCTITNTDDTPTLKLVKSVVGGSATAASFTLSAAAPGNPLTRNFSSQTATPTFHNVAANATYTLSETGPAGYTASAWSCNGGTQVGATIQVPLGAAVTCTITNTRDLGNITATKYHDLNANGSPAGDPVLSGWTLFVDLNKNGVLDGNDLSGTTNGSGQVSFTGLETTVNGQTYWVCEVLQAGWVNSDPGAGSVTPNGTCKAVTVAKDTTTQVQLGNFQRIGIQVNKTLDQLTVPNGVTFQFSIRKDASTNPGGVNGGFGTVIATGSVTGPDNAITSAEWAVAGGQQYLLNPGTYQLCEAIVEGYTPNWTQGAYGVDWFSPGIQAAGGFQEAENTLVCISFTVVSGDGGADHIVEFNVDNVTKGFSHTIGFWKNWTSCDGSGNQFAMLDLVFNGGTRNGITYQGADDSNGNGQRDIRIGNLYIEGTHYCRIAVDLLDKRPVGDPSKLGDKAKAASDPVYNSVSQLVAFELNQLLNATGTGSAACQAKASDAARLMQRFLSYIDFRMSGNNSTYTMPSNKTQTKQIETNLLYLANVIDDYNNNTIGSCMVALALPNPTVGTSSTTWVSILPAYTDT